MKLKVLNKIYSFYDVSDTIKIQAIENGPRKFISDLDNLRKLFPSDNIEGL